MKADVWESVGRIGVAGVPDPRIEEPTDAIIRITTSAICGTDLHLVRGTLPGMRPGQIVGHEAVGEVVAVGRDVRNFSPGDRVVVGSTIACGYCSYCRAGYESQCDNANPAGPRAGTAFYGGPTSAGGYPGLQAEYARIPFASANLVSLFNPEKLIFGGGVFGPATQFLDAIAAQARKWAQPISIQRVEFVASQLGPDAALYGAGYLAMRK